MFDETAIGSPGGPTWQSALHGDEVSQLSMGAANEANLRNEPNLCGAQAIQGTPRQFHRQSLASSFTAH